MGCDGVTLPQKVQVQIVLIWGQWCPGETDSLHSALLYALSLLQGTPMAFVTPYCGMLHIPSAVCSHDLCPLCGCSMSLSPLCCALSTLLVGASLVGALMSLPLLCPSSSPSCGKKVCSLWLTPPCPPLFQVLVCTAAEERPSGGAADLHPHHCSTPNCPPPAGSVLSPAPLQSRYQGPWCACVRETLTSGSEHPGTGQPLPSNRLFPEFDLGPHTPHVTAAPPAHQKGRAPGPSAACWGSGPESGNISSRAAWSLKRLCPSS